MVWVTCYDSDGLPLASVSGIDDVSVSGSDVLMLKLLPRGESMVTATDLAHQTA